MGSFTRRHWIAPVVASLGLALAACGGGSTGTSENSASDPSQSTTKPGSTATSETTSDSSGPTDTSEATATTEGAAETASGGELVVGIEGNVASVDPYGRLSDGPSRQLARTVFDPLMPTEGSEHDIGLAESFEADDDTATQFTMKLRSGVMFHDGTPFNAQAVVTQLDRSRAEESKSSAKALLADVESIEAIDDTTVHFTLTAPFPAFPTIFSAENPSVAYIPSPAAVEQSGDTFGTNPVGTGAYKLERWADGESFSFVRNEEYWNGTPPLDRIEYRPLPSQQQRYSSLRAGDIDIFITLSTQAVADAKDGGFDSQVFESPGTHTILFNTAQAPFDNVTLRRALAAAVDRDAITKVVFDDVPSPATNPIEGNPLAADAEWPVYDPDLAKQLLAEAGEVDPITLNYFAGDDVRQKIAELVAQMWNAVGVEATAEAVDRPTLLGAVIAGEFTDTVYVTLPVSSNLSELYQYYHSASNQNRSNIADPELDAGVETGRSAVDPSEAEAGYKEAINRIAALAPEIYLSNTAGVAVYKDCVGGVYPSWGANVILANTLTSAC